MPNLSLRFSTLAVAAFAMPVAFAGQLTFTATFTPTLNLHAIRAYAAYGSASWGLLGSLATATGGAPAVFSATTDAGKNADGRFALVGVYDRFVATPAPHYEQGVSVVMTATNAAYALDDGAGHSRPFTGTNPGTGATGVFPFYMESTVQSYLENGGSNLTYIMNSYDQAGATNRYVIGSGLQSIVNFSDATLGGSATVVVSPVPEPAPLAALGLGAVAILRRRKRG